MNVHKLNIFKSYSDFLPKFNSEISNNIFKGDLLDD